MKKTYIIKKLFNNYTKHYLPKIFLSVFFSLCVAASTSVIAWLLDPAIKKIFIEKDKTLLLIIPLTIIIAFTIKGFSLYFARVILIRIAQEVTKLLQFDLMKSLINSDIEVINKKHSGKIIGHLTVDVSFMTNLISTVILNIFKDTLTLIGLLGVMFYQNWKLALFAMIMIPLASFAARSLGKRMGKITTEAQEEAGKLNSYILEIFKNHKIIKIFQKENYEYSRADNVLDSLKEKMTKINVVLNRASPIMETLTGIMIAGLIYYAGKLIYTNELEVNNFFSFLAAMMLAYQPVKTLTKVNVAIGQGLAAAKRILPIIDMKVEINSNDNSKNLNFKSGNISFNNINFTEKQINELNNDYQELQNQYPNPIQVAVRSSAIAEDLPNASFAGQQDTYLNITNFKENSFVEHHIRSVDQFYESDVKQIFKDLNPLSYSVEMNKRSNAYQYNMKIYFGGKNNDKIYYCFY